MTADLAIFAPPAAARRSLAVEARHLHPAALPRWRALLGVRWQERLELVTEFCRHRAATWPGEVTRANLPAPFPHSANQAAQAQPTANGSIGPMRVQRQTISLVVCPLKLEASH